MNRITKKHLGTFKILEQWHITLITTAEQGSIVFSV